MPETVEESWVLASGLRDDMVLSVTDAYFATDANYQGGNVYLLHLIGLDENNEVIQPLKMSVGPDWQSADGGNTITHPTKVKQRINASTIYGHWISFAQEIPELVAELFRRGSPTNAKVWEGLVIHVIEKEIRFGRNIESQMRLMPHEYLGLVSEAIQSPATVMAAHGLTTQGIPTVPTTNGVDPQALLAQARAAAAGTASPVHPIYTKYYELAKTTEWGLFLATALADPDVLADEELAQQIINQSLLYTQARST